MSLFNPSGMFNPCIVCSETFCGMKLEVATAEFVANFLGNNITEDIYCR